jgi:hypothetical protein
MPRSDEGSGVARDARWGRSAWGTFRWGEEPAEEVQPYAKADTRLLVLDSTPDDDLSQWGRSLTDSGGGAFAASADWAALQTRTIELRASLQDDVDGILVQHGPTSATPGAYAIEIDSGALICSDGNGTVFSVDPPGLTSTGRTYVIAWSTHANPLTTGGLDAYTSELAVYDETSGDWLVTQAYHRAPPASDSDNLGIGGRYNGTSLSEEHAVIDLRLSARSHSTTETREDWVAETVPDWPDHALRVEQLPLPDEVGEVGELAGPQYAASAGAHRQNGLRLLSPLWQCLPPDPPTLEDDLADVFPEAWIRTPPSGAGWQASTCWLVYAPTPPTCNKARVRVDAQLWATSGDPDLLEVRVYSANRMPGPPVFVTPGVPPPPPLAAYFVTGSRSTNDTSTGRGGPLTWAGSGYLRLAKDQQGGTWLFLAVRMNGGAAASTTRAKLRAITVTPVFQPSSGPDVTS